MLGEAVSFQQGAGGSLWPAGEWLVSPWLVPVLGSEYGLSWGRVGGLASSWEPRIRYTTAEEAGCNIHCFWGNTLLIIHGGEYLKDVNAGHRPSWGIMGFLQFNLKWFSKYVGCFVFACFPKDVVVGID